MRNKTVFIIFFLTALAVVATLALAEPSWAGKLEEAIAKTPVGIGQGHDPSRHAPRGSWGFPGRPIISGCFTSYGVFG